MADNDDDNIRCSGVCLGFLSSIMIFCGVLLVIGHQKHCVRFFEYAYFIMGVPLLLASVVVGTIGAEHRKISLFWISATITPIFIILLFCFTVVGFAGINGGAGDAVSGKGFKEFHLENYSSWLQTLIIKSGGGWESCLADTNTCSRLNSKYSTVDEFDATDLSPIQSGCCKPPTTCGYRFVSPSNWTKSTATSSNSDCATWSNEPKELCYSCNSCKAGFLHTIKKQWFRFSILNVVLLFFWIVGYSIACWAFKRWRTNMSYEDE